MEKLLGCTGFQWDAGNAEKNRVRHRVTQAEVEQAFFNRPLIVAIDQRHSVDEVRSYALGWTDAGRLLFVAFTYRATLIRVISARDMSRRERRVYHDEQAEADTEV